MPETIDVQISFTFSPLQIIHGFTIQYSDIYRTQAISNGKKSFKKVPTLKGKNHIEEALLVIIFIDISAFEVHTY
jgi:hypothetical protein